jgi:hypothetical protein
MEGQGQGHKVLASMPFEVLSHSSWHDMICHWVASLPANQTEHLQGTKHCMIGR